MFDFQRIPFICVVVKYQGYLFSYGSHPINQVLPRQTRGRVVQGWHQLSPVILPWPSSSWITPGLACLSSTVSCWSGLEQQHREAHPKLAVENLGMLPPFGFVQKNTDTLKAAISIEKNGRKWCFQPLVSWSKMTKSDHNLRSPNLLRRPPKEKAMITMVIMCRLHSLFGLHYPCSFENGYIVTIDTPSGIKDALCQCLREATGEAWPFEYRSNLVIPAFTTQTFGVGFMMFYLYINSWHHMCIYCIYT